MYDKRHDLYVRGEGRLGMNGWLRAAARSHATTTIGDDPIGGQERQGR